MERKEYNVPSVDVIPASKDDVIATSKIHLPPHIIGRPRDEENGIDNY